MLPTREIVVLLLLGAVVAADGVFLEDGRRIEGTVVEIAVAGADGRISRFKGSEVAAVRLASDRELLDERSLAKNLRFALARARIEPRGGVGVYMGRGAFAPSAQAVVRRLEEGGVSPRLLFASDVAPAGLKGLRAIVVPGGWAPSMLAALGADGQRALRDFCEGGGGYLGICAGGYLPCETVVWEGREHPYPLRLMPGRAEGPVAGLAPWPNSGGVKLSLGGGRKVRALYAGGSSFDVEGARVLARYPDGSAAIVRKGKMILTGAHVEFAAGKDVDLLEGWATNVEAGDGLLFRELLGLVRK